MPSGKSESLSLQELLRSLIAKEGVTTAAGAVGKTSLIDTALIGVNDYLTGKTVVLLTDVAAKEDKVITGFNSGTGEVTFGAMSAQVAAGVSYIVLNIANPGSSLITVIANVASIKTQTDKTPKFSFTMVADWSPSQLTATIPAAAGTLTLPSVVLAGLPAGATIVKAKAYLTSRLISNTNVAGNSLNGATVAATSQVVQIQKGAGAWNDAIVFIDAEFSQAGLVGEGGIFKPSVDLSAVITGNDTYNFQWLLARAQLDAIVLQGVKIAIQVSYTL
jgi:hypothetical protein